MQIFNMKHGKDVPALFAFVYSGTVSRIVPTIRPDDYGVTSEATAISQAIPLFTTEVVLWGVPSDPIHNSERGPVIPGSLPRKPFLTNPTSCSESSARIRVRADSWQHPGAFVSRDLEGDAEGVPYIFSGCDRLSFDPSIAVQVGSGRAAEPSALNVNITVPQDESPDGLATADVRKTVVTLPQGMSVSPSSAAGLGACSPVQIGIGSNDPPTCPDSSKIGTVKIKTPLLDEELEGDVILAKQKDNPFGTLLAMYLAVKGPGFYLKLPGKVEADPVTGQLTTTFDNTPQLPFEELHLSLRGGPNAPLSTPSACGTYSVHTEMTSWASSTPVSLNSPLTIDQGCNTGGFDPKLNAGTTSPIAGGFSPFTLQVTRQDGEQNISRIQATLPEGALAKLAGVPLCAEAQAVTGDCPPASQVGTTTVGAGAGSNPLYVPQPGKAPTAVYLSGPYKGAPYSLVVKVPAQAGPFDLGNVVVRNALNVDPVSTKVTATSDPLPQILEGIPLSYRDVRVEITRPDFTTNPTSCDPMSVNSTISSIAGKTANPSSHFQVTNCAALGFKPQLSLKVSGGTKRHSFPSLKAVLTQPKSQANIAKVAVTLPHSEFLEQAHIGTVCTRVQFAADACPKASVYGTATATTPLLDKPLSGPVYLRSSNHPLPDLVASLHGAIDVDLSGRIDSVKGGIRASFETVPDAPVSRFVLSMKGGRKGLLVNSRNLCAGENRAKVLIDAQNGKTADQGPVVQNSCGKKARKRARR